MTFVAFGRASKKSIKYSWILLFREKHKYIFELNKIRYILFGWNCLPCQKERGIWTRLWHQKRIHQRRYEGKESDERERPQIAQVLRQRLAQIPRNGPPEGHRPHDDTERQTKPPRRRRDVTGHKDKEGEVESGSDAVQYLRRQQPDPHADSVPVDQPMVDDVGQNETPKRQGV
mmetsp:Transcript_29796/g.68381  ORF Transcript_29796/g.68381 Transcript_29796/m.68381 type:complete len:174 (+) Transcript_29796:3-524(+)